MNVFEAVKHTVAASDVAQMHGLKINRQGLVRCPFHSDHTPSMKVDNRYFCFGCGAKGDATDLEAKLSGISVTEAALKLAEMFSVEYVYAGKKRSDNAVKVNAAETKNKVTINQTYPDKSSDIGKIRMTNTRFVQAYRELLELDKRIYAPECMDEEWDFRFVRALVLLEKAKYLEDVLLFETDDFFERNIDKIQKEVKRLGEELFGSGE